MKDLFTYINEGILDPTNKNKVADSVDITDMLWNGLVENHNNRKLFEETGEWLKDFLVNNATVAKLGSYRGKIVPMDSKKDYIHIQYSEGKPFCIQILVDGLNFDWYSNDTGWGKRFYKVDDKKIPEFYQVYKDYMPFEVPDAVKPFVEKCIAQVVRENKLRKYKR